MSENTFVTFDQISDFGDLIPAGHEFFARAKKIEAKSTKQKEDGTGGGKPFLQITFDVLHGEFEGLEFSKSYFLNITKSQKNGRMYGKGVLELCADMTAIGKPLPKDYRWEMAPSLKDVQALAKLVAERVRPTVTPKIKVKSIAEPMQAKNEATGKWEDQYNEDGTKKTRAKYLIVGGSSAATDVAASTAVNEQAAPAEQTQDEALALL